MQSASSRIWTRVAVSIFYDDNHYITGTSTTKNRLYLLEKTKRVHNYIVCNQEINYYYYFTPCEFVSPALAVGPSFDSEWQHVSSGLQDSSQYFVRYLERCNLHGLVSFSDF